MKSIHYSRQDRWPDEGAAEHSLSTFQSVASPELHSSQEIPLKWPPLN